MSAVARFWGWRGMTGNGSALHGVDGDGSPTKVTGSVNAEGVQRLSVQSVTGVWTALEIDAAGAVTAVARGATKQRAQDRAWGPSAA
jgi:hypothetical protein